MNKRKVPKIRFKGFYDDWEQRKLGEIIQLGGSGGTPSATNPNYYGGEIPFLGIADIEGRDIVHTAKTLTEKGLRNSAAWIVPAGAVSLAMYASVGKVGIIRQDTATSQAFYNMVFEDVAIRDFVFTRLEKADASFEWEPYISTGTQRNLNAAKVKAFAIAVPGSREAAKIGRYFANLDSLITLHQRKLEKLKIIKKSMLENCFPKNGEQVPKIRFSGFSDDWEQRKLGEVTELKSASRVHKGEWTDSGVPFFRSSDVMAAINGATNEKAYISEELYEKLSSASGKLEKGDVLVTGGGSVGNPYIVPNNEPLYTKDADLLWIKNQGRFHPYFLYEHFFSPTFRTYLNSISHVGTIAHYTITQLSETSICLPDIEEQIKVGEYFDSLDHLITLHQSKLEKLKMIKKSMLETMFV